MKRHLFLQIISLFSSFSGFLRSWALKNGREKAESLAAAVIAQGLAAVEVLDLEIEKAPVTYNPILRYFNNAGLGIIAGA